MSSKTTPSTRILSVREQCYYVRKFAVTVRDGADAGARVESTGDELSIGAEGGNDLVLTDGAVSRHHVVLRATERGLKVRDLGSTNGSFVGEVEIRDGLIVSGTRLRLGRTIVEVEILTDEIEQPLAAQDRFGELLGASPAMRRLFPLLDRCASSAATVLITGETGTGKEIAAESIHAASDRNDAPFVVVDCGALPRQLMESELFGHARGAFTGADDARVGAFEAADGGTLFLDEIGELPVELQPVLLRVLESRKFKPVGSDSERTVDVRIVAATNRDLRVEVNDKRFRADLYFRLNVLRVELPPLRDRAGDIELLADHFWQKFRSDGPMPEDLAVALSRGAYPGNVRELRNAVERAALVGWRPEAAESGEAAMSFGEAKDAATLLWERGYIERLLSRHGGNLSHASKAARMSRSHLRLLMQRHGIDRDDFSR